MATRVSDRAYGPLAERSDDASPVKGRTLRAALVAVWAWGSLNAVSSPQAGAMPPPPNPLYRYDIGAAGVALQCGEPHEFLAVTASDRPDLRHHRLLRFSYTPAAPARAVPLGVDDGPGTKVLFPRGGPLRGFSAKPAGLAVEPSGVLVVVFDDDREWKPLFAGYEQPDGLFTVIDPRP